MSGGRERGSPQVVLHFAPRPARSSGIDRARSMQSTTGSSSDLHCRHLRQAYSGATRSRSRARRGLPRRSLLPSKARRSPRRPKSWWKPGDETDDAKIVCALIENGGPARRQPHLQLCASSRSNFSVKSPSTVLLGPIDDRVAERQLRSPAGAAVASAHSASARLDPPPSALARWSRTGSGSSRASRFDVPKSRANTSSSGRRSPRGSASSRPSSPRSAADRPRRPGRGRFPLLVARRRRRMLLCLALLGAVEVFRFPSADRLGSLQFRFRARQVLPFTIALGFLMEKGVRTALADSAVRDRAGSRSVPRILPRPDWCSSPALRSSRSLLASASVRQQLPWFCWLSRRSGPLGHSAPAGEMACRVSSRTQTARLALDPGRDQRAHAA